ncbi:MAG TPA: hypothetical protein VN947_11245, partial [Polyangia bacterium]|nr:hypothetical protein [Polyangia bacterium]
DRTSKGGWYAVDVHSRAYEAAQQEGLAAEGQPLMQDGRRLRHYQDGGRRLLPIAVSAAGGLEEVRSGAREVRGRL